MKKLLLLLFCGLLFAPVASASLWSYYTSKGEQLPPVSERAIIAESCGIENYVGSYDQNVALEECLGQGQLGATLPEIAALFESSLQNSVASDATTMSLVSATLKNGSTLSGLYGFIIDEGSSNEEFVICTASSTALTGCLRGIDPVDGKTEVTALQYSHRRGASIKITDYPILGIMRRILNGEESLPNQIYYETYATPTDPLALVAKQYADSLAIAASTIWLPSGNDIYNSNSGYVNIYNASTTNLVNTGNATNTGNLVVSGNQTISGTLGVTGTSTFGVIVGSGTLGVTGTSTFTGDVVGAYDSTFGAGTDGASTTAGNITLTRDYYFTNYTIATGTTVRTNGYRVFVNGTLTVGGTLTNSGGNGGTGDTGGNAADITDCSITPAGGTAGAGTNWGTLAGSYAGTAGGVGGVGETQGGKSASSSAVTTSSVNYSGVVGASGGRGGEYSGTLANQTAGTIGTTTLKSYLSSPILATNPYIAAYFLENSSGSTGGAGGNGGYFNSSGNPTRACGGAGGGAGGNGGIILLVAKNIIVSAGGTIESNGGNGGNGGGGGTASGTGTLEGGGGGGGGAGGNGGQIIFIYSSLTNNGTITVTAGTGGGAGAAGVGDSPQAGSAGTAGNAGYIYYFQQ